LGGYSPFRLNYLFIIRDCIYCIIDLVRSQEKAVVIDTCDVVEILMSCELRVASCELRVAGCELRDAGCGVFDCGLKERSKGRCKKE